MYRKDDVPCFEAVYDVPAMSGGVAMRPYMEATLMMLPLPVRGPTILFYAASMNVLLSCGR